MHTCLVSLMTQDYIHRSGLFPRFLFLFSRYLEMSSFYSFLSHILCRLLNVLLEFLEVLQQLYLQVAVLCSAHVQAFYAKVHLALLMASCRVRGLQAFTHPRSGSVRASLNNIVNLLSDISVIRGILGSKMGLLRKIIK